MCIPPFSAGKAGVPIKTVAEGLYEGFDRYLEENKGNTCLKKVAIIIFDNDKTNKPQASAFGNAFLT